MEESSFFWRALKKGLLGFWAGYNKVNEVMAVVLLIAISLVVFAQVLFRYVFQTPFGWTDEFAIFGFIWLCFLGAAVAEKRGRHFRVTVLVDKMGPKTRLVVDIVLHLILFVILYRFFLDGIRYFQQGKAGISAIMQIPLSYIYLAVPVSIALLFLNRIKVFIDSVITYTRMIKDPNYKPPAESL